jgi:hypothetical protein
MIFTILKYSKAKLHASSVIISMNRKLRSINVRTIIIQILS